MLSKQTFNLFRLNHSTTFYWRPESQPFLETVEMPENTYVVSTLHVTFETGWLRESMAGSGGSCQAVGTNLNSAIQSCQRQPGSATLALEWHPFTYLHDVWASDSPWNTKEEAPTKRETASLSRQSKIGTACTRLIITKWWIKRGLHFEGWFQSCVSTITWSTVFMRQRKWFVYQSCF